MSNYLRSYSNLMEVTMCPIQPIRQPYHFPKPMEDELRQAVLKNNHVPLQNLLKYIHCKFDDQGLQSTLIHRVFSSTEIEIQYYVPELVYIAIRKNCAPMKKLLIYQANQSQSLRRLILWNVKAFTVLMKQKGEAIKKNIDDFQQKLIQNVKSQNQFTHSLKAIAMLTQASLTLKKMPPEVMKDKLKKFIRRFNYQYLNNFNHSIIIPFRHDQHERFHSNYVVQLVEDDCSCFPTRKRVPYRIIIQTIDQKELKDHKPNQKFYHMQRVAPDEERDLYDEVHEIVEKMFTEKTLNLSRDTHPFVVDNQESKKISELKNFRINIEKEEMKEPVLGKAHHLSAMHNSHSINIGIRRKNSLSKYKIKPTQNLKRFEAIYIPNLSSQHRKSDIFYDRVYNNKGFNPGNLDKTHGKSRISVNQNEADEPMVKIYRDQIKEWNFTAQSIWGEAWEQKKSRYRQSSYFSRFRSLRHRNVVLKGGDDLRQQIVCMQLIYKIRDIIKKAKLNILIKPYEIIVLSQNSGILQFVSNSISIDEMKKKSDNPTILKFFNDIFQTDLKIKQAKENFVRSLAGSSILTYVLKFKDRHNGNILLDMDGNIIHIDFGYILGLAPGNINFESSPFKLTFQYVQLMGGKHSPLYNLFTDLFCSGMLAIRKRIDELTLILQIMMDGSDLECFKDFKIEQFQHSFRMNLKDRQYRQFCQKLVEKSCMNFMTIQYDNFQEYSNGIRP